MLSLCAGYGGLDRGLQLELPNSEVVLFSEWDLPACEMLLRRMAMGELPPAPIWTDLRTLPYDQLVGKVDVITGGFPCQPFSSAGKRKADEDPRHLFPHFKRAIGIIRPAIGFFENVEGILSATLSGDGWNDPAGTPVALHLIKELQREGYSAAFGLFSAEEVGLPHRRKRVFFLAVRNGEHKRLESFIRRAQAEGRPDPAGREQGEQLGDASGKSAELRRAAEAILEAQVQGDSPRRDSAGCSGAPANAKGRKHAGKNAGRKRRKANFSTGRIKFWETTSAPGRIAGLGEEHEIGEYPRTCHEDDSKAVVPVVGSPIDGDSTVVGFANSVLCDPYYRKTGLRLCGNGVVPATAALAFRTLWKELSNPGLLRPPK
jgi:DNA (cytosine-5)-methyltransferase 1